MCIAFAFGMSTALEVTDVAQGIADIFTTISEKIGGKSASFVAIYIATALLSGGNPYTAIESACHAAGM